MWHFLDGAVMLSLLLATVSGIPPNIIMTTPPPIRRIVVITRKPTEGSALPGSDFIRQVVVGGVEANETEPRRESEDVSSTFRVHKTPEGVAISGKLLMDGFRTNAPQPRRVGVRVLKASTASSSVTPPSSTANTSDPFDELFPELNETSTGPMSQALAGTPIPATTAPEGQGEDWNKTAQDKFPPPWFLLEQKAAAEAERRRRQHLDALAQCLRLRTQASAVEARLWVPAGASLLLFLSSLFLLYLYLRERSLRAICLSCDKIYASTT